MRTLVVADLHYSLKQLDWLLRKGPDYDQVVVAGDLLDYAAHVDAEAQIVVISRYLSRLAERVPTIVCSGNHDADGLDSAGERHAAWLQELREDGVRVDGEQVRVEGALITICPWWEGPRSKERVASLVAAADRRPGERWIWIYHVPPAESPIAWNGKVDNGDPFLSELIARHRPDIVLCGHVHAAPFRQGSWVGRIGETWVFNPGRQIGELPTFIELDLGNDRAGWFSLAGEAEQSLA